MIELPEAAVMADQINVHLSGKTVKTVIANHSPHKFAWFYGNPEDYPGLLEGRKVGKALSRGGMIKIEMGELRLLFSDGINLRFHPIRESLPQKHQLLLEFEDATFLAATVQMYGGLWCFPAGENDNPYYLAAREKPSPLSEAFTFDYFLALPAEEKQQAKSVKAILATEQRIPGLGNGVLQDILYNACLHPKRKWNTLSEEEKRVLFSSVKDTLKEMVRQGGRDTEVDLLGKPGKYETRASRNSVGNPCPRCGTAIVKEAYMGGSVYFCPRCQPL